MCQLINSGTFVTFGFDYVRVLHRTCNTIFTERLVVIYHLTITYFERFSIRSKDNVLGQTHSKISAVSTV